MATKEPESWITVHGKHIPIGAGESKEEAIKKALNKDADDKEKQIQKNKEEADKKKSDENKPDLNALKSQAEEMIKNEQFSKLGQFLSDHRKEFGLRKNEDAYMRAFDVIKGNSTLKLLNKENDIKEKQIADNKKEAGRLNKPEVDNLGNKSTLKDPNEYSKNEYAKELATAIKDTDTSVYQINYNGGKAFADTSESKGYTYIEMMGSTGKGAGTEILARVAEKALKAGNKLEWTADEKSAMNYYSHIGADKYISSKSYIGNSYSIPNKDLKAFIAMLRGRKGK